MSAAAPAKGSGYGAGAKILSIGIASTGVVTFAYFSVASYALDDDAQYKSIALLWSVLFVIVSVIYRPIEQLLSRTIAGRRARGLHTGHPLRTPLLIQAEWEQRQAPNLEYKIMKAENLPFADDEFDVATAIEVLEHVPDPAHTVAEMARVAQRWLLASVPREPLWRGLNVARGAYIRDLGNTPGHINHWSKRAFVALLSRHGEVVEARSPFPWTMLLVRL